MKHRFNNCRNQAIALKFRLLSIRGIKRVLIDQLDFLQQADSLVLANYESDQNIADVPDLGLQNLNLSADGKPNRFLSTDKTCT